MNQTLRDAAESHFAPGSPGSSDSGRATKADQLTKLRTAMRAREQAAKIVQKQARWSARATTRFLPERGTPLPISCPRGDDDSPALCAGDARTPSIWVQAPASAAFTTSDGS